MGERGPSKTPTNLKLLRGETRESRLNRKAPRPRGGGPEMPAGMSRAAQAVWRRQTRAMALTGVLTVVDADALRAYCDAVARYAQAERRYQKEGPLVPGIGGAGLVKNPLHQVIRDNAVLIRQFARELGFVPGAREGITVEDPAETVDTLGSWEARS